MPPPPSPAAHSKLLFAYSAATCCPLPRQSWVRAVGSAMCMAGPLLQRCRGAESTLPCAARP